LPGRTGQGACACPFIHRVKALLPPIDWSSLDSALAVLPSFLFSPAKQARAALCVQNRAVAADDPQGIVFVCLTGARFRLYISCNLCPSDGRGLVVPGSREGRYRFSNGQPAAVSGRPRPCSAPQPCAKE
jgi:hypothetical protein